MIDSEGLSKKRHTSVFPYKTFEIMILRSKNVLSQKFFQIYKDPPELELQTAHCVPVSVKFAWKPISKNLNLYCFRTSFN